MSKTTCPNCGKFLYGNLLAGHLNLCGHKKLTKYIPTERQIRQIDHKAWEAYHTSTIGTGNEQSKEEALYGEGSYL